MRRSEHILAALKSQAQPARIVGLAVETEGEQIGTDPPAVREYLARWAAAGWASSQGKGDILWERSGDSAVLAWESIDYALSRGGLTWVVSWGACRAWGLLGVWRMLEKREVILYGDDVDGIDVRGAGGVLPPVPGERCGTDAELSRDTGGQMPGVRAERGAGGGAGRARNAARRDAGRTALLEDPPTVIRIRRPGGTGSILIVDVANYGIPAPDRQRPVLEVARHARDTILRMVEILRVNKWGGLRATVGAQAWATWLTAYYTHWALVHNRPVALELEDAAYIGGRCECGRMGAYKGRVYHVDYRGLYPSICAGHCLPALLSRVDAAPGKISRLTRDMETNQVAEVYLSTLEPAYPYRRDGETYYPIGTFYTTLCGEELRHAVERDRVRGVGRVAHYRCSPLLRDYAAGVWRVRMGLGLAGNDPIDAWIKMLLVCLPGKCGARGYEWVPAPDVMLLRDWGEWWACTPGQPPKHYRALGGHVDEEIRSTWGPQALPAVACHITAAGRMALWRAIVQAGHDNVLYYDTDSLIVTERGWQLLWLAGMIGSGELGRLRLIEESDYCDVRGIKDYTFGGVVKRAGVPKGGALPSGNPDLYWFAQHARGAIQAQSMPQEVLILRRYAKVAPYHHGTVGSDGVVSPLLVKE